MNINITDFNSPKGVRASLIFSRVVFSLLCVKCSTVPLGNLKSSFSSFACNCYYLYYNQEKHGTSSGDLVVSHRLKLGDPAEVLLFLYVIQIVVVSTFKHKAETMTNIVARKLEAVYLFFERGPGQHRGLWSITESDTCKFLMSYTHNY